MKVADINLAPDAAILVQARINASRPALPLRELSNLIVHDPVISMAFFHTANSVIYAGASTADSFDSILPRLGVNKIVKILNELHDLPTIGNERIADTLEVLRFNCRRTSIISLIVATVLQPQRAEIARLSGLLADVGHMLCLMNFGDSYCDLIEQHGRGGIAYRVQKEHNVDIKRSLVTYLQSRGVPEQMWLAYDENTQKTGQDLKMALMVRAAIELIEAADSGKIEKFNPDNELPARSSLRLLDVSGADHNKIFKTCLAYLKKFEEEAPEGAGMLLTSLEEETVEPESDDPMDQPIKIPTYPAPQIKAKSREKLQQLFDLCETERDEGKLLESTVQVIVGDGLFSRAALISVNTERAEGVVVQGAEFGLATGSTFPIDDPLSPFYHFRVQIKSTNIKQVGANAPFDQSAYALGPVGLPTDNDRLVLYSDVAGDGSLSMEMRKIFRLALTVIGEALKALRATGEAGVGAEGEKVAQPSSAPAATKPEAKAASAPPKAESPSATQASPSKPAAPGSAASSPKPPAAGATPAPSKPLASAAMSKPAAPAGNGSASKKPAVSTVAPPPPPPPPKRK
jgi:HD-like signal output (HDOD) protein